AVVNNGLSSGIPDSLGSLPSLVSIDLRGNYLVGDRPLPSSVAALFDWNCYSDLARQKDNDTCFIAVSAVVSTLVVAFAVALLAVGLHRRRHGVPLFPLVQRPSAGSSSLQSARGTGGGEGGVSGPGVSLPLVSRRRAGDVLGAAAARSTSPGGAGKGAAGKAAAGKAADYARARSPLRPSSSASSASTAVSLSPPPSAFDSGDGGDGDELPPPLVPNLDAAFARRRARALLATAPPQPGTAGASGAPSKSLDFGDLSSRVANRSNSSSSSNAPAAAGAAVLLSPPPRYPSSILLPLPPPPAATKSATAAAGAGAPDRPSSLTQARLIAAVSASAPPPPAGIAAAYPTTQPAPPTAASTPSLPRFSDLFLPPVPAALPETPHSAATAALLAEAPPVPVSVAPRRHGERRRRAASPPPAYAA
ncbi:hypothetical protein HK405_008845, partial [Cladochytrium tenue]